LSNDLQDISIQKYLGLELDLSESRDVIGHVTIWYQCAISCRRLG